MIFSEMEEAGLAISLTKWFQKLGGGGGEGATKLRSLDVVGLKQKPPDMRSSLKLRRRLGHLYPALLGRNNPSSGPQTYAYLKNFRQLLSPAFSASILFEW